MLENNEYVSKARLLEIIDKVYEQGIISVSFQQDVSEKGNPESLYTEYESTGNPRLIIEYKRK